MKHFCTWGNHYPQGEQLAHQVTGSCLCCVPGARATVQSPSPLAEQLYGTCFQILQSQGCTECHSASKSPLSEKKSPVSPLPCPAGLLSPLLSSAAGLSLKARCSLTASDMIYISVAHFTLMDTRGHFKRSFTEKVWYLSYDKTLQHISIAQCPYDKQQRWVLMVATKGILEGWVQFLTLVLPEHQNQYHPNPYKGWHRGLSSYKIFCLRR